MVMPSNKGKRLLLFNIVQKCVEKSIKVHKK
jgi:hypothetical protein